MQIINLRNRENGNVRYEIIHFPDGQPHIRLVDELNHKDNVVIDTRITNVDWLFILVQLLDICNRHGITPYVYIWYLMGGRMDRVMSFNEPYTLKIIQDILSQYDATFELYEPHSYHSIKGKFVNAVIAHNFHDKKDDIICFPDEGAIDRYVFLLNKPYICCKKKRDSATGTLSGFELDLRGVDIVDKDVMVIDDICDGGGTFCGIAPLIRKHNPKTLSLSVAHAIQKEGILKVAALYDNVYITDSYKDWQNEDLPSNVTVTKLIR